MGPSGAAAGVPAVMAVHSDGDPAEPRGVIWRSMEVNGKRSTPQQVFLGLLFQPPTVRPGPQVSARLGRWPVSCVDAT